jgi:excisionase family DNA binding protein
MEKLYSIKKFAELASKHPNSVRNAILRGELHAVRVGRSIRIPESALQDWLKPYLPGAYGVWAKSGIQRPLVPAKTEGRAVDGR